MDKIREEILFRGPIGDLIPEHSSNYTVEFILVRHEISNLQELFTYYNRLLVEREILDG